MTTYVPAISVKDLQFSYKDRPVLQNVNLDIPPQASLGFSVPTEREKQHCSTLSVD